MQIHGACHCGLISFAAEIDRSRVMVCHRTDCQVLSGSPFRYVVAAPADSFHLSGSPKSYIKLAQSGNRRTQVFCPECGTPLYATAPENPTWVSIRLGCVQERAQLKPAVQIWQHSALPWLPELPNVPGSPEQQAFLPARTPRTPTHNECRLTRGSAGQPTAGFAGRGLPVTRNVGLHGTLETVGRFPGGRKA